MKWNSVKNGLPPEGGYLVRFIIQVVGNGLEDRILCGRGYLNPEVGWSVSNSYVVSYNHVKGYEGGNWRVTHWMPLPEEPNEVE